MCSRHQGTTALLLVGLTAAVSCTGDAFLGAEPLATHVPTGVPDAARDAGPMPSAAGPDASHTPAPDGGSSTAVSSAPLSLTFVSGGKRASELVVSCPDTCADVELAAMGGMPPYVFSWEDAAAGAMRSYCPTADGTLRASVRDAHGDERSATLAVRRLACTVGQICADNASFEGSPIRGPEWLTTAQLGAAPWDDCRASGSVSASALPRIVDLTSGDEFPASSDGDTYLYVPARGDSHAAVAQNLCAPLVRGSSYAFKIDLAYAAEDRNGVPIEPGRVEVYASSGSCQRDTLLWTSPALRTAWRTYCIAFEPHQNMSALVFSATAPAGADAAVFIDHLVPVTSCP